MNTITFGGPAGEIRWGYHLAAKVGQWSVSADTTGGALTGTVVSADPIKCGQQPLMFVVSRPNGRRWVWPIVDTLHIAGDTMSARVGLQEVE